MARVRLPKRPPTPSESDETEEEEEEEEELALPVGALAEVRTDDPGFAGSFYDVTVTGHLPSGHYTVVYSTLEADAGGGPLQETAAAADVRPRPPPPCDTPRRGFALLEPVEAFHSEGWWAGVVSAIPAPLAAGAPRVYAVAFPTSRETLEFGEAALRPHRVYRGGRWVPAAEVVEDGSPLFRQGNQVEVSQSGNNFGESWSPACVLKVIAATTFLVQYMHNGEYGQRATEIIDCQYIRPARNGVPIDSKYRAAPSCHVEVMHQGTWWPGVVRQVLGRGINTKYAVKLKSYETDMDDVECLDVLVVGYTQLRPHFDWDRNKWVRRLPEEFVNGTKLPSKKRPRSSALSLYNEIGECSGKNGSHRGKKLKSADVVSEPTSPLLSVCMHKSSSCTEETMTQGNAVVALRSQLELPSLPSWAGFVNFSHSSLALSSHPEQASSQKIIRSQLELPSLPSWAGFANFSHSSLALSSHPEQASSQKIIPPSAPVSQSRELQASVSGTFGQPRPIPQSPHFGTQSVNPGTPKNGAAAKSIEEARNILSISTGLAKSKTGIDDVELRGRGMIPEINSVNCIVPTTTPNNVGGSQQGGDSAVDDLLSESQAIQNAPFVKTSTIWPQIDAMEIFSKGPQQRPHLNQFREHGPEYHEGMAAGLMISFADIAESISRLEVEDDLEGGMLDRKMQGLSFLEANGFDVGALRSRLETLLCRRSTRGAEPHDGAMQMLEKIAREETSDRELGMRIRMLGMALHHLGLYARLMRHMMRSAVTRKINNAVEISRLKSEANKLQQSAVFATVSR